jgi:pyruvate dehydrogenase E2 component (dihydrolipoamide acetyltransferase)
MAKVLKMPALGQTVEEVRILQWFKGEGDFVEKGEPLAEVETDKVNIAWESPESGVVRRLLAAADAFVPVEAPVVIVGTADEPIDDLLPAGDATGTAAPASSGAPAAPSEGVTAADSPLPSAAAVSASDASDVRLSPRARRAADALGIVVTALAGRGTGPNGRVQEQDVAAFHEEQRAAADRAAEAAGRGPKASPLARAVASGSGLDLSDLAGSGANGRIVADDVRQRAEDRPSPAPGGGTRTVALTGLRKRVADNVSRSIRTAPHVTLNRSADMGEAQRLRADLLAAVEKATGGVRLSPTDILVKACAAALREFPHVNAHIGGAGDGGGADTLTLFEDVHVGLAVSLGDEGLIVPVIKDVGRKGLAEIARARQDLAARAREGRLGADDIAGATFTITNLGAWGVESFNPIINPPQVAILGVGAIADQVVARGGVPTVRPMMGLSLSFDHRALDGAPAAAFLARLAEILENPYLLLA